MNYRRLQYRGGTYFFTVVTHNRNPIFSDATAIELFKKAFRYVKSRHPLILNAYAIMPDHIHMIWRLPENNIDYSTRWMLIKCKFSREYNYFRNYSKQPIWQKRYWEHLIRDQEDFNHHMDYIHYNPVKHGLVLSPKNWEHSSFHECVKNGLYAPNWGTNHVELPNMIGGE